MSEDLECDFLKLGQLILDPFMYTSVTFDDWLPIEKHSSVAECDKDVSFSEKLMIGVVGADVSQLHNLANSLSRDEDKEYSVCSMARHKICKVLSEGLRRREKSMEINMVLA